MNKKRVGVVFLVLAIAIGGWLWLSGAFGDAKLQALKDEDIKELSLSEVEDGNYEGIKYYNDDIYIKVEVTVENHEISQINMVEDLTAKGDRVVGLADKIISEKTLDVDTVSGATISSLLLILAVQDAIVEVIE